ncbi:hypothetical protein [Chryseobacterium sp. VD8]|uniref:hypothetical protein n=1 Tax=Chryseobacterium sp. VD8 TaxID=3081254 RepID=UPI003018D2A2
MTKKMISWLSFMAVFLFLLHSCVHDEINSSSDPASAEYHSKSLWKEDEKYIKNVMKIYSEHEDNIKKFSGTPDWDYAMSMERYDESFMVVPIIENGKVVNTLACARFDKKVYFRYENSETNKAFFQNIIYGKYTRYKTEADNTKTNTHKGIVCITKTISMWYPDNESNPNAGGYWETNYYTNCYNFLDYSGLGWEDNGGGGYDYGGGGGSGNNDPNNPNNQTPCEKTKDLLTKPDVQAVVSNLKNHLSSGAGGEKGWKFNKVGNPTETSNNSEHSVTVGDPSLINGTYHNHTGTKVDIFSATDIATLIEIARYQSIGNAGNAFSGLVAPNGIHYVIYFNGSHADLPPSGSYSETDIKVWEIKMLRMKDNLLNDSNFYNMINGTKVLNEKGLEQIFFSVLQKMGLQDKIVLQKIDNLTNKILNIEQSSDGTIITASCQ